MSSFILEINVLLILSLRPSGWGESQPQLFSALSVTLPALGLGQALRLRLC